MPIKINNSSRFYSGYSVQAVALAARAEELAAEIGELQQEIRAAP
jgi:hypothetical protein